ncbi:DUF1848 domain-containing protein [Lachnoclostridium phytofermentans]|uniref:DUF1848 domain-containing protein n=1 Tax=Lachnoclostridium phytofermentans (strain ATCC 700394 / DSM 18823 / ISDg) TaxID=357809 RepID=A9KT64_LACP7|nr:DUF1848 domain-containing protein [Lachnoclostridium phytofermentans]ABX42275.1 Domain of unknown function DUF1848 [Lachnoclostridium phytofermentans ISDg]
MILSVSRRTDIPNYYMEWFLERLKEEVVCIRNPYNPHQVSRIPLRKEDIDCIVFWTKHPSGLIEQLNELNDYMYYIQFTLTGYGKDIEPSLPDKRTVLIPQFLSLAEKLGNERIVWRYDPIMINGRYTVEYHIKAFEQIATALDGATDHVVISFLDLYRKMKSRENKNDPFREVTKEEIYELSAEFVNIAKQHRMTVMTCSEEISLDHLGIEHGCCIDKSKIEELLGYKLKAKKDNNQRATCGCMQSIDIGSYDTCPSGCVYCYATETKDHVEFNRKRYDIHSKLLCDSISTTDKITLRKVASLKM